MEGWYTTSKRALRVSSYSHLSHVSFSCALLGDQRIIWATMRTLVTNFLFDILLMFMFTLSIYFYLSWITGTDHVCQKLVLTVFHRGRGLVYIFLVGTPSLLWEASVSRSSFCSAIHTAGENSTSVTRSKIAKVSNLRKNFPKLTFFPLNRKDT